MTGMTIRFIKLTTLDEQRQLETIAGMLFVTFLKIVLTLSNRSYETLLLNQLAIIFMTYTLYGKKN